MLFLFPGALELWLYLLPKILIRFSPPSVKSLTRLSWTGKEFRFFLQYLHIKNMAIPRTRKAITTTTANITTSFPKSINICNQTENEYWQEFKLWNYFDFDFVKNILPFDSSDPDEPLSCTRLTGYGGKSDPAVVWYSNLLLMLSDSGADSDICAVWCLLVFFNNYCLYLFVARDVPRFRFKCTKLNGNK